MLYDGYLITEYRSKRQHSFNNNFPFQFLKTKNCKEIHTKKMIETSCSEEQNDLADDTNDAVDDIVAGLITWPDPIFGGSNQSILGCNHQTNLDPVSSPKNSNKKMRMIKFILTWMYHCTLPPNELIYGMATTKYKKHLFI